MAGRHVPLMGRRQAGIDVGAALGDPAKLDRRAAGQPLDVPELGQKGIGGRVEMGIARVWIAATSVAASAAAPGVSRSRCAPPPGAVRQTIPSAGAATIPRTGRPARTSPRLIVNSSRPATNSRVPSTGSTRMNSLPTAPVAARAWASSEMTGTPGSSRATPSMMMASEASSAAVTGDWSALVRVWSALARTARIAAAARDTIVVRSAMRLESEGTLMDRRRVVLPWRMTRRGVSRAFALGNLSRSIRIASAFCNPRFVPPCQPETSSCPAP
jgi:hypothetical protein